MRVNREKLADKTIGMWEERKDISDELKYVNEMREEWSTRIKRMNDEKSLKFIEEIQLIK